MERGAEGVLNIEPNTCIGVAYHPLFAPHNDLLLFEIDDNNLLSQLLHQMVTIRGHPNEDAVLCTPSKTFAIKFSATSNSVFLIPPSSSSSSPPQLASVFKLAHGTIELLQVPPRIDKLRLLLSHNPLTSNSNSNDARLYTWDDLLDEVQASDDELRAGLRALSAVEIAGHWRIVDESYMTMILSNLLHNSVLNDWSLNALDEDQVVRVLESDGFPTVLARHCLSVYGCRMDQGPGINLWKLDERRVCINFAREILKRGKMRMESFMEDWVRKVPEGMQVDFDMLEGQVLTEKIGVEVWVHAFSVSSLPSNPADRFSILFRERLKWEWKDLQPYIRDLNVPGLSFEGLLLKYTRRTQPSPDSEPIFSAR